MRVSKGLLFAFAVWMMSKDSIAESDAGPQKVVIPPRVEEAEVPPFDAEAFPMEKSKAPTASEWKTAPRVRLTRTAQGITECHAFRLREWMKIHCDRHTAGMRLIAGSTEGIALWIVPEPAPTKDEPEPFSATGTAAEIIFPVRLGDRRLFETFDLVSGGYEGGWGTGIALLVEEQWKEGAKNPSIAVLLR